MSQINGRKARSESSKVQKSARLLTTIGLVALLAVAGYLYYRNQAIDRLYAEAGGYPSFFRSTGQSLDAVRRLGTYRGSRATGMLLEIALGRGPLVSSDVQTEAIKVLAKRKDPEVALVLANLLQPHEGLETRLAAAKALQSLPCNTECVEGILRYLDRIASGEPNYEDRTVRPAEFQSVNASLQKDQQTLYAALDVVLQQEKATTLKELVSTYGLGSNAPSTFALTLVPRLGLAEACPVLRQSNQAVEQMPDSYKAPRQELRAAISSLKCE